MENFVGDVRAAQRNARLVGAMEIGTSGLAETIALGELSIVAGVLWRVITVPDFDGIQPEARHFFHPEREFIPVIARHADRMRERTDSARSAQTRDCLLKRNLAAVN